MHEIIPGDGPVELVGADGLSEQQKDLAFEVNDQRGDNRITFLRSATEWSLTDRAAVAERFGFQDLAAELRAAP